MAGSKAANDVVENEGSYERMVYISAVNVSEKKQKKWDLKNTHRRHFKDVK
jgi:hypothetical protein